MKHSWKTRIIPLAVTLAVGGLAALLTMGCMDRYKELAQPSFAPPAWLFPVVWTILYILMGISAGRILRSDSPEKDTALFAYGAQLFVNFWWPIFFFCWELRLLALFWLILLICLVAIMVFQFRSIDRTAAILQLPYIVWLIFALSLNLAVYILNR